MSTHTFKAGDVAMLALADDREERVFCTTRLGEPSWVRANGGQVLVDNVIARPLVTIDPEEITSLDETAGEDPGREIANCLRRLAEGDFSGSYRRRVAERLAEHFAPTPPKPAEPTRWGAVVVDDEGCKWIRADDDDEPWRCHTTAGWDDWDAIPVTSPDQIKFAGVDA